MSALVQLSACLEAPRSGYHKSTRYQFLPGGKKLSRVEWKSADMGPTLLNRHFSPLLVELSIEFIDHFNVDNNILALKTLLPQQRQTLVCVAAYRQQGHGPVGGVQSAENCFLLEQIELALILALKQCFWGSKLVLIIDVFINNFRPGSK